MLYEKCSQNRRTFERLPQRTHAPHTKGRLLPAFFFTFSLFLSFSLGYFHRSNAVGFRDTLKRQGIVEEKERGRTGRWEGETEHEIRVRRGQSIACIAVNERRRGQERKREREEWSLTVEQYEMSSVRNFFLAKLRGVWLQNPSSPRTRESFFFSFFQTRDFSIHESSRNLARRRQNFPFRSACLWNDHDRRWNSSFHLILSWSIELDKGTGEQAKWSVVNHCTLAWHELWVRAQARPTKFLSSNFWASNFFASFFFREMWNDRKEFNSCEKNSTREF